MKREADISRKTKETDITLSLCLDGKGNAQVETGVGFLDHMLDLLAKFSGFDLRIQAKGDLQVDTHHLVEDTGICLGKAFKKAVGDKSGITRFGFASAPMDEVLVQVSLDISGRPYLKFGVPVIKGREGSFETEDAEEFLKGFVIHSGITLHVNLSYGDKGLSPNLHHVNEAVFKGLGLALKQAVKIEGVGIPSTKGSID